MAKSKKEVKEKVEKVYSEGVVSAKKIQTDLRRKEPPLVDVKVTNPLTYIKSWWKKIIGNEGLELRLRIKPLTAIAISLVVVSVSYGLGRIVLPFKLPFFEYSPLPIVKENLPKFFVRETAFSGKLQFTSENNRYYLITSGSEAITLEVPENIDLSDFIGTRIFATGKYNEETRTLLVTNTSDLELLPKEVTPIPTSLPTPTITPTPSPKPTETIIQASPTELPQE